MSRLATCKPRDELTDEQREAYDHLSTTLEKARGKNGDLFKYKAEDGSFLGPFAFCLAELPAGKAFLELATKLRDIPLSSDARETAILVVGTHFQAAYEIYAHEIVAQRVAGLSKLQVDAITAGRKPDGLDEACSTAYDLSDHLISKPGPLPQNLWEASNRILGHESTIGLIHYIGYYAYVSIVLNATDAKVPSR